MLHLGRTKRGSRRWSVFFLLVPLTWTPFLFSPLHRFSTTSHFVFHRVFSSLAPLPHRRSHRRALSADERVVPPSFSLLFLLPLFWPVCPWCPCARTAQTRERRKVVAGESCARCGKMMRCTTYLVGGGGGGGCDGCGGTTTDRWSRPWRWRRRLV